MSWPKKTPRGWKSIPEPNSDLLLNPERSAPSDADAEVVSDSARQSLTLPYSSLSFSFFLNTDAREQCNRFSIWKPMKEKISQRQNCAGGSAK
jgi:hypothetical protein